MGLYVMDCDNLAEMASILGKVQDAKELKAKLFREVSNAEQILEKWARRL